MIHQLKTELEQKIELDLKLRNLESIIVSSIMNHSHRYLWTGPYVAPFFFFFLRFCWTSTFFHINNILQLSMYHCMTYIQEIQSNSSFYPCRVSDMIYRHGMCFRASSVFVLSILFWFPQCTHYFLRVFRFLFMEHKQDYSVTSVKDVKVCF